MSFKATLTVTCWKEHRCLGCGTSYRYKFTRQATGSGNTEEDAKGAADKDAVKKLEREVDARPCPECGCLQPDMIAQEKNQLHLGTMTLAAVAAVVLLIMAAIPSATWMPYSLAAAILGGISALAVLGHWVIALGNPNSSKTKNIEKAAKLVEDGDMQVARKPDADRAEGDPRAVAPSALLWLLLATASLLLIAAPVLMKTVSGWPSNGGVKPEVAGPGDTLRLYFTTSIDCVQNRWNGSPTASAKLPDGRVVPVPAVSQSDSWGDSMSVKRSEKSTHPTLWAEVTLPKDAPAGEEVDVSVSMDVRYPMMGAGNQFTQGGTTAALNRKLTLAPAGARETYRLTFWAMIGGSVLLAVAGVALAAAAGRLANDAPHARVFPVRETDGQEDEWKK